jgi:hypothetical protein
MRKRLTALYRENPAAVIGGTFALFAIVWGIFMSKQSPYNFPHQFHHTIDSPILAMELARDSADVSAVTQRDNPAAKHSIKVNTILDCVFIPLYVGYLLFFALAYAPRSRLLAPLMVGVGVFDYLENTGMFISLAGGAPRQYYPSAIKWTLLGLAVILIARLMVKADSGPYSMPTRRLLALVFGAAGGLMLLGISASHYSWLALGSEIFAATFVVNAIGLLGPIVAMEGEKLKFVEDFCEQKKVNPAIAAVSEIPTTSGGDEEGPRQQKRGNTLG